MEVESLPDIFLHLYIVLIFLCLGLVILRFPIFTMSVIMWARDSLALLLL